MWYVHFQAKQNSHADCGITGPATPGLTVPLTAPLLTVSKNWSGTAALVGYMFSDQTLRLAVAEAPIPLPETLDEPSLEEPSIRETEPAAHEVTYEIVEEGSRQQHRKLINSWEHSYNINRRKKTAVIWQCTVRKGHYCKATVKEVDGAFHKTQVHDHQPAVGAATVAKVVSAVKRKALEDIFKPASAIVQEVLLEKVSTTAPCPALSKPEYLARTANWFRRSKRPKDPTSIESELEDDALPENFLHADVETNTRRHLILRMEAPLVELQMQLVGDQKLSRIQ
ncbi:hypothetical protein P5673_007735 [Acropora cervicornis]|uniref:FLYWCH-type domain-containing protein n=1 Tax=Acropora cervicornis TaxID=6130 RepID=A0AAD9QUW5_ACRCE|nr:hypothetical protein P5673_007735 [Acropora cervicornis]